MLASNDAELVDDKGAGIPAAEFLTMLDGLPEDGPASASIRWAVVVGPDGLLKLQLQSLPMAAVPLSGRSAFKG